MKAFQNYYHYHDLGLLLLRVGVGIMLTVHGYPKLIGGTEKWAQVGQAMGTIGIHFAPAFWGFLAAVAEAVGGQLLALGLFFRVACLFLLGTMIMATISTLGQGFGAYAEPLEMAFVFLGLLLAGPGKYSLDQVLFPRPRRRY